MTAIAERALLEAQQRIAVLEAAAAVSKRLDGITIKRTTWKTKPKKGASPAEIAAHVPVVMQDMQINGLPGISWKGFKFTPEQWDRIVAIAGDITVAVDAHRHHWDGRVVTEA